MHSVLDVTYGPLPQHKLDIYLPHGPTSISLGLIVFVHGGAWRSEDKTEHAELARRLGTRTGLAVALPNYRLTPRAPAQDGSDALQHPAHAQDVLSALNFLSDSNLNAGRYDASNIYLMGHSCGAHILASIFLDSGSPPLVPPPELLAATRSIVVSEGIFDIDLLLESFPAYREGFIENTFGVQQRYNNVSAISFPLRPRGIHTHWVIIHSTGDTLVDPLQAKAFFEHIRAEYQDAGSKQVTLDLESLSGDHNAILKTEEYANVVANYISKFLTN